jgi:spermidine synthase
MKNLLLLFVAVFAAGISSLQMELSLLREASFVLGSTASTNSFIISIFLAGLALGAYGATHLLRRAPGRARQIFVFSQLVACLSIVLFVFTRLDFLYGDISNEGTYIYFGAMTLVPSLVAGMSFTLFVNLLYGRGEKYISAVYAVSTIGNVLSGFAHGLVIVPYFGMATTYMVAILGAGLAAFLVSGYKPLGQASLVGLVLAAAALGLVGRPLPAEILWSEDDVHGVVQIIDASDKWEGYGGGIGVDLRIHNKHNCANGEWDMKWQKGIADHARTLLGGQIKRVLNIGFCSGKTIDRFLEFPGVEEVVTVDMNRTVLRASEKFFPEIYQRVMADKRSQVVIDEFRNYVRHLDDDEIFDVVVIDISVDDPYYHGMFTRELFVELHEHMSSQGVLFIAKRYTLRTLGDVFDHCYTPSERFRKKFFFFTKNQLPPRQLEGLEAYNANKRSGVVHTDHEIYEVEANERAVLSHRSHYFPRWARQVFGAS